MTCMTCGNYFAKVANIIVDPSSVPSVNEIGPSQLELARHVSTTVLARQYSVKLHSVNNCCTSARIEVGMAKLGGCVKREERAAVILSFPLDKWASE